MGANSYACRSYRGKLVGGLFWHLPSWIELKRKPFTKKKEETKPKKIGKRKEEVINPTRFVQSLLGEEQYATVKISENSKGAFIEYVCEGTAHYKKLELE